MKKYTETHEWVEVRDKNAVIGISQFAAGELGDIVFVELPIVDTSLNAGEVAAVLESTKAAADVYAPISGRVTEVNLQLKKTPEIIGTSPENEGWIYKIALKDHGELSELLDKEAYEKMIAGT